MLCAGFRTIASHREACRTGLPCSCAGSYRSDVARQSVLTEKEVISTNYVDAVLGVLLILAFVRGFAGGVWKSVFNLGSTAAAFGAAYLLTAPAVNLVERNYRVLGSMSSWWNTVFRPVPGLSLPYDPATFDEAMSAAGGEGWASIFKGALRQNLASVQSVAGANPTWGTMLSLALARLVLSAAVFLLLLAVFRMLCNLLAGSFAIGAPTSFSSRLLGGVVEAALSAVWLSIFAGVLYPVLSAGLLGKAGDAAGASALMTGLLSIYGVLWPFLLAKVK